MSTIRSIDIMDVARALGSRPFSATPRKVADWLSEQYSAKKGGGFNYDPAISVVYDAFRGGHSLESATEYCRVNGNPKGRQQNSAAIAAIMPYALEHPSVCHRIGLTAAAIGRFNERTIYAKLKTPLVRVEGSQAFVVIPGFRMSYRPQEVEIDFACSVAREILAQGDYSVADTEYLYAGPGPDLGSKDRPRRMFRAIHGKDRHQFSLEQINRLLDIFVKGVALAADEGADIRGPDLRGYRIIDPNQPGLGL
jgi:hypothetical protein